MSGDQTFSFRTVLRIHDIQGPSSSSPYNGETVGKIPGVVTAKRSNGFYLQDPNADGDDSTSEAMFVFATGALLTARAIGDAVTVDGSVTEFAFDATQLSITELRATNVVSVGSGPAITPTIIGTGGRIPPTTSIAAGIAFYQSLEGML